MKINFRSLSGAFILVAAAGFPSTAIAQPNPSIQPTGNLTVTEAFDRAFFKYDLNFFGDNSVGSQLDVIFGTGSVFQNSFPENEIRRDAKQVHKLYQEVLEQQTSSDPIVRTPDLPNPYSTSILRSPRVNVNSNNKLNELIFDRDVSR